MLKRLLKKKQNNGFTLVEVIISIAALGVICAVLLRLFVLSSDTNTAAGNAQKAELLASSTIESITCADTIEKGMKSLGLTFKEDIEQYSFEEQNLTAVIKIKLPKQDFPGKLYDIDVIVQDGDKQLSSIPVKKYVQRSAYE